MCNADESEPGTFKDRLILEEDPFALVESMTIEGFAVGASRGYLYLRGEYPLARERLEHAIREARAAGLLGDDVLGSGWAFDIELRIGAGAYIVGEETALFESIEGGRPEPRNKPPFPVEHGLFRQPTAVNNVETLVNVPLILRMGAAAYAQIGTEGSTGPKLFCLSGHVATPGVYEVAFGETLGGLLERAGGVPGGRAIQAILLGGAAGAFVGPDALDTPLTFEGTRAAGATLGSGVVMVFDETADLAGRAAPDRRVLPRRVVRPVRPVPGRDRAPGGAARAARRRGAARLGRRRARPVRRPRPGDARRLDLRARPDGVLGDRERAAARARPLRRSGGLMAIDHIPFEPPARPTQRPVGAAGPPDRRRGAHDRRHRRSASRSARRSSRPPAHWASTPRPCATSRT